SLIPNPLPHFSSSIELFLSNARSIRRKTHLLSYIKSLGYHLILLSETWLREDESDAYLLCSNDDYVVFRKDRPSTSVTSRGGGVAILSSPLLNPFLVSTFSCNGIESVIIDIHHSSNCISIPFKKVRICMIYRSPSYLGILMQPSLKFNDHITKIISKARAQVNIMTLEQRRLISDLLFLHKSIHGFYSYDHSSLYKISPLTRNLRRAHALRLSLPFTTPKSHSSFVTRSIDRWNVLSNEIVTSSPKLFRCYLLSLPAISFTSESLLRL
ncbi:hypothetical protein PMAYCL1PPCAC_31663, partial [Pristionchus mayeri]